MNQLVETYIGLVGLGLVLYFVFNDTAKTQTILAGVGGAGTSFVNTLEAR